MSAFDRGIELAMTVVLIIGGYQFYFWAQRQTWREARYLMTRYDDWIEFDARWVWVYSGLYYPMILLVALAQPDWEDFARTTGGFLLLLLLQLPFFLFLPVAIPKSWRENARMSQGALLHPRSMRFIETVWSFDKLRNSMPSMHVSVATMVDLSISHHWHSFAAIGWLFPTLIGVSALKTKQHYVVDVGPGAVMGASVYWLWHWIV